MKMNNQSQPSFTQHPTCLHMRNPNTYKYIHTYIPRGTTSFETNVLAYEESKYICMHTYIHTYVRICIRTYIHTYVCIYIHTCQHARRHSKHTCLHTRYPNTHTHIHTCILTNRPNVIWSEVSIQCLTCLNRYHVVIIEFDPGTRSFGTDKTNVVSDLSQTYVTYSGHSQVT